MAVACVASGAAALIYEIVWFQRLQLSIGSSTLSLGVLLATLMGGMCIGSLRLHRVVSRGTDPLVAFALLELGVAGCGAALDPLIPFLGAWYDGAAPAGRLGLVCRAVIAAVCLLPPTVLMGATLPALARWAGGTRAATSRIGLLQAANVAGAVAGCLLAGFVLLPWLDMRAANGVAIAMNIAAAAAALAAARRSAWVSGTLTTGPQPASAPGIWLAIGLSGLAALGSEVVWTRLLALLLGGTTYAFSLILAVFLGGLGLGNAVGSALVRSTGDPRAALGWCQFAAAVAVAWGWWQGVAGLPFWPVDPALPTPRLAAVTFDLVRCGWLVLPAAVLWGASFPLAVAASGGGTADPARSVGHVLAANTAGAILGALGSVAAIWHVGSQRTQQGLLAATVVAGLVPLATSASARRRPLVLGAAVAIAAWAAATLPPIPGVLVGYGRQAAKHAGWDEFLFVGEGLQADVAVSRSAAGRLNYHNAGKVQASSEPQDMRLQRMLGHLTTLLARDPRRVLVIGCGAGVTAGAVSLDPAVEAETIVEIEPLVPRSVAAFFGGHNHRVLENPKVAVRIDDARHFLLTARESFDAVTSDPLDPWVKGAAALFTVEFLEAVRGRLAPGGVFTLFVQLYETTEDAVRSELASFFHVFPEGLVFANTSFGRGYDLVLVGRPNAGPIDVDAVEARLGEPAMEAVARSLREVGFSSGVELLATCAGGAADLEPWLRGAPLNRDGDLRLQYLAGRGLNEQQSDHILERILDHATDLPVAAFSGRDPTIARLRAALLRTRGRPEGR